MRKKTDDPLKLGKGQSFFVKSRLKRLPQEDEVWEADFRALPKPMGQNETHYLGMVLTRPHGALLSEEEVERTPSVNDLANLLAQAMRRPGFESAHRPRRILVRKNPRWAELFPHLKEIGVEVGVEDDLPKVCEAYEEFLQQEQQARSGKKVKPSAQQASVEKLFPTVARWVRGYGHIEIGEEESFGFVARALTYGNLAFEDDKPGTLAEALAALEKGLRQYFKDEGIDLE